jgi:hypothetical protein
MTVTTTSVKPAALATNETSMLDLPVIYFLLIKLSR